MPGTGIYVPRNPPPRRRNGVLLTQKIGPPHGFMRGFFFFHPLRLTGASPLNAINEKAPALWPRLFQIRHGGLDPPSGTFPNALDPAPSNLIQLRQQVAKFHISTPALRQAQGPSLRMTRVNYFLLRWLFLIHSVLWTSGMSSSKRSVCGSFVLSSTSAGVPWFTILPSCMMKIRSET